MATHSFVAALFLTIMQNYFTEEDSTISRQCARLLHVSYLCICTREKRTRRMLLGLESKPVVHTQSGGLNLKFFSAL